MGGHNITWSQLYSGTSNVINHHWVGLFLSLPHYSKLQKDSKVIYLYLTRSNVGNPRFGPLCPSSAGVYFFFWWRGVIHHFHIHILWYEGLSEPRAPQMAIRLGQFESSKIGSYDQPWSTLINLDHPWSPLINLDISVSHWIHAGLVQVMELPRPSRWRRWETGGGTQEERTMDAPLRRLGRGEDVGFVRK